MAYSRTSHDGGDVVLVVVSLDPYAVAEATLHLDTELLGLARRPLSRCTTSFPGKVTPGGPDPYVRFDPLYRVAHILHVPNQV